MKTLISFLTKAIKGDIPLWKIYWVYNFCGSVTFYIVNHILVYNNLNHGFFYTTFALFWLLYWIFLVTAILRSAIKYTGGKVWKYLAISVTIFSICITLVVLIVSMIRFYDAELITDEIQEFNRSLPSSTRNKYLRLDYIEEKDGDIYFHYTLLENMADSDIERFKAYSNSIKSVQCSDEFVKIMLRKNRKIIHQYHDTLGNPIIKIETSKSDCLL